MEIDNQESDKQNNDEIDSLKEGGSDQKHKSKINSNIIKDASSSAPASSQNASYQSDIYVPPHNQSLSIDEDEFKDYFSNPLKRKEFDRKRLHQQMREIQSIAGFSLGRFGQDSLKQNRAMTLVLPEEDQDLKALKSQSKNYATVSLCFLSVTNPFRSKVIQFVLINPWFDRFILAIIFLNSVFLGMYNEVDFVTKYSDQIDLIFLIIFSIEMCLKIIAMGFFSKPFSYLRDAWNVLDFLVVVLGWVSVMLTSLNIQSIRIIRLLRPLRTINQVPGMIGLVSTIINSMPVMVDILVLFIFFLVMLGTISTQLFMGQLVRRCFSKDIFGNSTLLLDSDNLQIFCDYDQDCASVQPPTNTSKSVCLNYQNPFDGTFGFDSVIWSDFQIFQIISLAGWGDFMYKIREATDSYQYDILFITFVVIGRYFIINLMFAVQFSFLRESFIEIDKKEQELKRIEHIKNGERKDAQSMSVYEESTQQNNGSLKGQNPQNQNLQNSNEEQQHAEQQKKSNQKKSKFKFIDFKFKQNKHIKDCSDKVRELVEDRKFGLFVTFLIIVNTLILATQFVGQPGWLNSIQDYSNTAFTICFTIEMILKIIGLGIKEYLQDYFNFFDGTIVILSILDLLNVFPGNAQVTVFRAFRLLRIFKLINQISQVKKLLVTVVNSLPSLSNLGFLTILFLFIYALIAKQVYGTYILYDTNGDLSRFQFATTGKSLLTMFVLLTGDGWNTIMVEAINASRDLLSSTAVFFCSNIIIGNFMMLNLFLAILIKFVNDDSQNKEEENETQTNNLSLINKEQSNNQNQGILSFLKQKSVENKNQEEIINEVELVKKSSEEESKSSCCSGSINISDRSQNSNIEVEFEKIKLELEQLSKQTIARFQKNQINKIQNPNSNNQVQQNKKVSLQLKSQIILSIQLMLNIFIAKFKQNLLV